MSSSKKKEKVQAAQKVDAAYLRQRAKEVFAKQNSQNMSNIIYYNISYIHSGPYVSKGCLINVMELHLRS